MADDLGTELSCYGTPEVYTPNLDQLASEGVRYTNLFTVAAVSSVSRSAMITGMYPVSINSHQHRTQYKPTLPEPVTPITHYLKDAGYYVSNGTIKDRTKFGKTDYNFIHSVDLLYDGPDWTGRKEGQPFFAQIQISYPHRPFKHDKEHPIDPDKVAIPPYYPDHPITRKDWALYLETIQVVDQQVGLILERLREEGLADNTIVFFFGDQGQPQLRSKQFMYEEGTHTPLMIRWPEKLAANTVCEDLISNIDLSAQTLSMAGINIPAYMHGQAFIGDQVAKRTYIASMRDRRDETVDRIRAIRTEQFRYIRNFYPDRPYTQWNAYKKFNYPVLTLMQIMHKEGRLTKEQDLFMSDHRPAEELYDIKNDPFELHNLITEPAHEKEIVELRKTMDNWLHTYDLAVYPEDDKEIVYAKVLMEKQYKQWMEEEGLSVNITDEAFLKWWYQKLQLSEPFVNRAPKYVSNK